MKSLHEIEKELNKFIELKNNRLFDFPPFQHITFNIAEITESIILLYEIKDIIQNNTIEDAKSILEKQRKDIIKELANIKYQKIGTRTYHMLKISLQQKLEGLNWVLDRDQFDDTI